MDVSLTTEVMAIFVIFLPILAKMWLLWQRPLDPCNQKCLLWIDQPLKNYTIEPKILLIAVTQAKLCRSEGSFAASLALREIVNFRYFCNKYGKLFKNLI